MFILLEEREPTLPRGAEPPGPCEADGTPPRGGLKDLSLEGRRAFGLGSTVSALWGPKHVHFTGVKDLILEGRRVFSLAGDQLGGFSAL